jgi:hypothetical protein
LIPHIRPAGDHLGAIQQGLHDVEAEIRSIEPSRQLDGQAARPAPDLDKEAVLLQPVRHEQLVLHLTDRSEIFRMTDADGQFQRSFFVFFIQQETFGMRLIRLNKPGRGDTIRIPSLASETHRDPGY